MAAIIGRVDGHSVIQTEDKRPKKRLAWRGDAACDVSPPYTEVMVHSVLIVEDDARLRDGFVQAVESTNDLRVVGAAADVAEGLRLVDALHPKVLLVDLALPDGHGITLIRHVAKTQPQCLPVVITIFDDDEGIIDCIRAGAIGYLLKEAHDLDIAKEIREVCEGGSPISAAIARRLLRWVNGATQPAEVTAGVVARGVLGSESAQPHAYRPPELSPQETSVLKLCAKGYEYKEIARLLSVRRTTIATYVKRIYQKLQVHSKTEAIYEARQHGLLED
jgi:DNA-binding NarL/FixJ family response regulator